MAIVREASEELRRAKEQAALEEQNQLIAERRAAAQKATIDLDTARATLREATAKATTAEKEASQFSLPEIKEPTDKSATIGETAGTATSLLTSALALEEVAKEIAGIVRNELDPGHANPRPLRRVVLVEDLHISERELLRNTIISRLEAFKTAFEAPAEPEQPPAIETRDLDVMLKELMESKGLRMAIGPLALPVVIAGATKLATAAATIGPAVIGFGLQLASALRSKYSLIGRTVDPDRRTLQVEVAEHLLAAGDPALRVMWPLLRAETETYLMRLFRDACVARDAYAARHRVGGGEVTEPEPGAEKSPVELVAIFDNYVASITEAETAADTPLLIRAAESELTVPQPDEHYSEFMLYVDIIKQAADGMIGYSVAKGTKAAFLGYAHGLYVLANREGELLAAGSVVKHKGAVLDVSTAQFSPTGG